MFSVAYTTTVETSKHPSGYQQSLGYLMGYALRLLKGKMTQVFRERGVALTMEQYIIVRHLGERDGLSQQALAEELGRNKTTITRAIDGLEKRNIAVRIPDKKDRRVKLIYLTLHGRTILQDMLEVAEGVFDEALRGISHEDVQTVRTALTTIQQNLQTPLSD